MIARLSLDHHAFPDPLGADASGLVAVGGDDHPERVWAAYIRGIFPWTGPGQPRLWWSPDPRFVLRTDRITPPRSLVKRMRQRPFAISFDTAFDAVLQHCATAARPGQRGTWLTTGLMRSMSALHEQGLAHSVEAWQGETLVGGLYGLQVNGVFCGESMFALAADASKVAFVTLVAHLRSWGVALVDCQVRTDHLARFGAEDWPRERFLQALAAAAPSTVPTGRWGVDPRI